MPRETLLGSTLERHHEIFGGLAHIYYVKQSGGVWQFRMWFLTPHCSPGINPLVI